MDVNILSLLFSPRMAVTGIASRPRWITAFLFLSILSVGLFVLAHPFAVQATVAHLPESATAEERNLIARTLSSERTVDCLFLPVRLLAGWFAFGLTLFGMTRAFAPPQAVHIVNVFSLEVHAEFLNVLARAAATLFLWVQRGTAVDPAFIPLSVATVVGSNDLLVRSLLNSLNPFTLWYLAVLTMGVRVQAGFSSLKSLLVVVLAWMAATAFSLGSMGIIRGLLHLAV